MVKQERLQLSTHAKRCDALPSTGGGGNLHCAGSSAEGNVSAKIPQTEFQFKEKYEMREIEQNLFTYIMPFSLRFDLFAVGVIGGGTCTFLSARVLCSAGH